ncbi:MAG: hypothetical protein ACRCSK_06680, partial [Fusobacteriaceae bacterium]
NLEQSKSALADFDVSIELEPENYQIYFDRADLKKFLSDYQGATQDYKTVENNATDPNLKDLAREKNKKMLMLKKYGTESSDNISIK